MFSDIMDNKGNNFTFIYTFFDAVALKRKCFILQIDI